MEGALLRFDRFLQEHLELSGLPLNQLIERLSEEEPSPYHRHEAQQVRRSVSKWMHRLDPGVPILPIDTDLSRPARLHHRAPHVYTDEEIQQVLQAALSFPSPRAPLRPMTLFTMLALAYCAGLRGGEVAHLTVGNCDPRDETIDIRETKFFKHRRLPMASGIRDWFGHARLDTTNHYARANLETKRRALNQIDPSTKPGRPHGGSLS